MSSQQKPDEAMPDAPAVEQPERDEEAPISKTQGRISILPGNTDTGASFCFEEEDHTLGNALRHMIMKNPEVEFCGYSIPHPSEAKMNVRIQTYDGTTPAEALTRGLKDLEDLCEVVAEKFTIARNAFDKRKA